MFRGSFSAEVSGGEKTTKKAIKKHDKYLRSMGTGPFKLDFVLFMNASSARFVL
jgi:hypothetical protein